MQEVLEDAELMTLLATYSKRRANETFQNPSDDRIYSSLLLNSAVFLQIYAAADFYTSGKDLMLNPPPVDVDISKILLSLTLHVLNYNLVLDPYSLNVFPSSLKLTGAYLLLLVILSYYLSKFIWSWLDQAIPIDKIHDD